MQKNYSINYNTIIKQKTVSNTPANIGRLSAFRDEVKRLSAFPLGILPTFYLLDYQTKEYEFITKEFQCYSKHNVEELVEGGIEKFLSIYQKDDLELYSEQIFTKNVEAIRNATPEEREQLLFTNSYRVYNNDKTISHILQKNKIITDPITGLPIYAYGCIYNLNNYNAFSRELFHQIEKIDDSNSGQKTILLSKSYMVYEEDRKLTSQEYRIIEFLLKGLTTKEIAQKLFISTHTIDTHRAHILKKTNCTNTVELISKLINGTI
jgi:DNA-binding CsgD family transcriptional regulator